MPGRDPLLYDARLALRERSWDIAWYLSLARAASGPVLELGAGTARVLVPMLEAGTDAYGLEFDRHMLALGKAKIAAKLGGEAAGRLSQGDMRRFRHDRAYALIAVPYNSFCLLQDRDELDRTLGSVELNLAPGGKLAFDVIVADELPWSKPPYRWDAGEQSMWVDERIVRFTEEGCFDPDTRAHRIRQRFFLPDGAEREETLTLHQWRIEDLEASLTARGWTRDDGVPGDRSSSPTSGTHAYSAVWRLLDRPEA